MWQTISLEVRFFLTSVLWGVILLVMYDCIRIVRRVIRHGSISMAIEDILYWIVSAVLIFRMMYVRNNGIIRGFSLIGILLGMILYKYSISEFLVEKVSKEIHIIIGWIRKLIHILTQPARYFIRKIKAFGRFIKKKCMVPIHYLKKKQKNMIDKTYRGLKQRGNKRKIKSKQKKAKKKKQSSKDNTISE